MSYRGGGLPYGGRAPVSYDDVDSSRDSRPAPPGDRNGYGAGGRGGYDRDYRGGGRGYDRDYERDRGGGYRGGGYERRRSRSPVRRDGDGGRGGRPRAYDYDDDYSRRDRGGYRSRSPPPRSGRRHTRSPSSSPPRRRRDSRSPSRSRSPRSRSPPPAPRDRRRDDDQDERKEKRAGKGKEPGVVTADDAAEVDEQDIAALMGFGGFGTTQGKAHEDDISAVSKRQERHYRQYMNRKGGFNRPLDKIR